jgi:large subunit GTPase 1
MPRKTEKQLAEANTYARRFCHGGVGRALENDKKRQQQAAKASRSAMKTSGVADSQAAKSVLEQSSLDTFISSAELSRAEFDGVRGNHLQDIDESAQLVNQKPKLESQGCHMVTDGSGPVVSIAEQEFAAAARRVYVPIPHRPKWNDGMGAEELCRLEGEAFLNWRRGLAQIEEGEGLVMTPYERNLDFWRQLWRCVERSDLLVQIIDARDPEFYRCQDLERYVSQWDAKRSLLLINKSDFLSAETRCAWKAHFAAAGVDVLFFSALRELVKLQRVPTTGSAKSDDASESAGPILPPHGPLMGDDDGEVIDCIMLMEELRSRLPKPDDNSGEEDADVNGGCIGFVGYPNVGKSSVINALFGAKKVSMSRTPGKTKHLQTLELPEFGVTLCDCPGLVFPSVVATKAHLVINGTVPITELREATPPARLVVQKVGLSRMMEKYGLPEGALKEAADALGDENAAADQPRVFLAALAMTRQHFLRYGVPDEGWGARKVLREYVTGEILHCERPRSFAPPPRVTAETSSSAATAEASSTEGVPGSNTTAQKPAAEASDDDFSDLDDFLESRGSQEKGPTKRGARKQNKRSQKGGAVLGKDAA